MDHNCICICNQQYCHAQLQSHLFVSANNPVVFVFVGVFTFVFVFVFAIRTIALERCKISCSANNLSLTAFSVCVLKGSCEEGGDEEEPCVYVFVFQVCLHSFLY